MVSLRGWLTAPLDGVTEKMTGGWNGSSVPVPVETTTTAPGESVLVVLVVPINNKLSVRSRAMLFRPFALRVTPVGSAVG